MTIRIGANPIGWSNDDLSEIGGDTPLETCLAEAREAGVEGMEKGNKLPNDGAGAEGQARRVRPGLRRRLVFDANCCAARRARSSTARRPHIAMTQGRRGRGPDRGRIAPTPIHGDRAAPLSKRPKLAAGDWAAFGARDDRVRRAASPTRACKLCYHHHMGTVVQSEADIDAFMARDQGAGASAARHRPRDLGRRRPRRAGARAIASASATFIARTCARRRCAEANAGDWSFLDSILGLGAELGVYTVPGDGMIDYRQRCSANSRAIRAGWCSRPSRTRRRRRPCLSAKKGVAHLARGARASGLG